MRNILLREAEPNICLFCVFSASFSYFCDANTFSSHGIWNTMNHVKWQSCFFMWWRSRIHLFVSSISRKLCSRFFLWVGDRHVSAFWISISRRTGIFDTHYYFQNYILRIPIEFVAFSKICVNPLLSFIHTNVVDLSKATAHHKNRLLISLDCWKHLKPEAMVRQGLRLCFVCWEWSALCGFLCHVVVVPDFEVMQVTQYVSCNGINGLLGLLFDQSSICLFSE